MKIKKLQILRHIIQLILFLIIPGLFIMTFSEIKVIYQMIIKGNFNFIQAFESITELLTAFLITILTGRFFCGWLCAFGAYNDLIHVVSSKLFKVKFKVNEKVDNLLKYIKYVVLLFILIFIWTTGSKLFTTSSPWDAFAQITNLKEVMSNFTIGFALLVLITAGSVFIERFFCRYLCPLGALFTILSKVSLFKIKKSKDKCGNCRACTNNCSMGIPLYKFNDIHGGECINCLKCVEICPRKNAGVNIMNTDVNPALASTAAIALFTGVYAINHVGALTLSKNITSKTSITATVNTTKSVMQKYKDGTYEGSGTGFREGTTVVSLEIKNGYISSIKTLSSQDSPEFYQRAENTITDEIISSQSTTVDTVSGATYSSMGIINAVADALSKALNK